MKDTKKLFDLIYKLCEVNHWEPEQIDFYQSKDGWAASIVFGDEVAYRVKTDGSVTRIY